MMVVMNFTASRVIMCPAVANITQLHVGCLHMKKFKVMNFYVTAFMSLLLFSCASGPATQGSVEPLSCPLVDAKESPQHLWSLEGFSAPESVVYDEHSKVLFVSNIVGNPTDKDKKGWISKVSLQGKFLEKKWTQGKKSIDGLKTSAALNAPKGLGIRGGLLWVSDIDRVIALQISSGRKAVVVDVKGAKFLNDIGFGQIGEEVFVSDMIDNKIYSIDKPVNEWVWLEGNQTESPNGLLGEAKELVVAGWGIGIKPDFSVERLGRVFSVGYKTKKVSPWTNKPIGNLDGIEADGENAVMVSDWMNGRVMRVTRSGKCQTLLQLPQGAADIHFVQKDRILLVPQMNKNTLSAYKVPVY